MPDPSTPNPSPSNPSTSNPPLSGLPALGKTAIVLGGAQGAAYAVARSLSQHGVRLVLTDTDADAAQMAARSLGQTGAGCDSANSRDMAKLSYDAADALGDIDTLVVALGASLAPGGSAAMAESDFLSHLQGQSLPLLHVARHFAPAMRARRHGAVVIMAQVPTHTDPWQDAASAWLTEATRALAREWAGSAVTVNTVISLRSDPATLPKFMTAPTGQGASLVSAPRQPAHAEVAQAALAFCRPLGATTGQVLRLDAGRSLMGA